MGDESSESKHARRRQQVRAAQAKHRRRKQEYITTLEKEVLRLQVQATQIRRNFVMAKMETAVLKEMISPREVAFRGLKEEHSEKSLHAQGLSYLPEMIPQQGNEGRLNGVSLTSTTHPVPWLSSDHETSSFTNKHAGKGTEGPHPVWTNSTFHDKGGRPEIPEYEFDMATLSPTSDTMMLSTGLASDTSWESPKSDDWSVANLTCVANDFA